MTTLFYKGGAGLPLRSSEAVYENKGFVRKVTTTTRRIRREAIILLVEDEAITRIALADALQTVGHQVIPAADGVQALSFLNKYRVDLVITDLANLSGFDLVSEICSKRPLLPILIISAYISQDAGRISDRNAEFMHKPINPPDLIATVQRLLPNFH
jgi:DNA-binding response OmpR family regulator